jgi:hypothetical protein
MVCGYIRPPIAEAILVILMGLTAKTALDQVFVSIPHLDGLKAIWVRLASDPVWHICLVCQAIVFFITAFRFYLGSLRYHQMRGGQFSRFRSLLWDVLGTLIIFVGFYVSALSLRSRGNFYPFIFILHICDATWFGGAWLIDVTPPAQQVLMKRFILLDLATVFGIGVSALAVWVFHFGFGSPFIFHWLCFSVLLIIGSVDFYLNNLFYFKGTV